MPSAYRICVIPGDGIGKEVIPQAARALRAAAAGHGVDLELEEQPWGSDYYLRTGRMMPPDGHEVVGAADATLFGAVGSPEVPDSVSAWGLVLSTRQRLDLYVNLRPIRGPGRAGGNADLDLVVVRENTEGEYTGIGGRLYRGTPRETATQVSVFTRQGIERIVDHAFSQVRPGGLLTSVTKSNALPHTMGLAASGNLNPERRIGIFEPVHGSAPDIAGKGVANPVGAINSAAMLLSFLGEHGAAASIERAVDGALSAGAVTPDLGGGCGTSEVGDEVVRRLRAGGAAASGVGG